MLLPPVYVAVGIATFDISCTKGVPLLLFSLLADVIAKTADGIAIFYNWADGIAMWLMFLPLFL